MCGLATAPIIAAMAKTATRLILGIELCNQSLTGRASTNDGTTCEFAGWLGLISALNALLPTHTQA